MRRSSNIEFSQTQRDSIRAIIKAIDGVNANNGYLPKAGDVRITITQISKIKENTTECYLYDEYYIPKDAFSVNPKEEDGEIITSEG